MGFSFVTGAAQHVLNDCSGLLQVLGSDPLQSKQQKLVNSIVFSTFGPFPTTANRVPSVRMDFRGGKKMQATRDRCNVPLGP